MGLEELYCCTPYLCEVHVLGALRRGGGVRLLLTVPVQRMGCFAKIVTNGFGPSFSHHPNIIFSSVPSKFYFLYQKKIMYSAFI